MKFLSVLPAVVLLGVWAQSSLAEGAPQATTSDGDGRSFQVKNRVRLEYDDNIYETGSDQEESFKIVEELEFLVNLSLDQTFIGLRYRPSYIWWDKREPDGDDFNHDMDFILTHSFTPRLSLSLKDTLRLAQQADQIDRGTVVRSQDDYVYNVADGQLSYLLAPSTRLEAGARHTLLDYTDDNDVATDNEDYEIAAGGVSLRRELSQATTVAGEARYEDTSYDGEDRGAESEYVGALVEHVFSPSLLGSVRGGVQFKQFNDDAIDDETAPYLDGSLTYLPSPATRLTAGAGYSMFEANVYPYANQDRTLGYVSVAHDVNARLSLYLAASYQLGEYNADQSIEVADSSSEPLEDGDEVVTQYSARATWKVNRRNWLEIGWQYLDLNSDVQDEYDRNRAEVGWRTQI